MAGYSTKTTLTILLKTYLQAVERLSRWQNGAEGEHTWCLQTLAPQVAVRGSGTGAMQMSLALPFDAFWRHGRLLVAVRIRDQPLFGRQVADPQLAEFRL